jgi:hypothetical protein
LLSNVYLHEVLDKWFSEVVQPRMKGQAHLIRYADDALIVFSEERDALRVLEALPKRFGRYGLTVHPEKTKLVQFQRPQGPPGRDTNRPQTFTFLGFTHYWGLSRKGKWIVTRKTESKRFGRALQSVSDWCRRHRHLPIREQWKALQQKLRGHYSYYGITGNAYALRNFLCEVTRAWHKWLSRRSRGHAMAWAKFVLLLQRYPLPPPRVVHSVYAAKL